MLKDMDNDMPTNLDNLTSLMVSHVDEDKIALRNKIEKALYRLMDENLVQRDDDKYIFLTNDEQQDGLSSREIDNISAWLMNERNPVCYGKDERWANHLYPVYLTEIYLKSQYISTENFINRF